jgi:hypothetical protein
MNHTYRTNLSIPLYTFSSKTGRAEPRIEEKMFKLTGSPADGHKRRIDGGWLVPEEDQTDTPVIVERREAQ